MRIRAILILLIAFPLVCLFSPVAHAQQIVEDTVTYSKAQVLEVEGSAVKDNPSQGIQVNYQTDKIKILEGVDKGKVLTTDTDFLHLKVGDLFYIRHTVNSLENIDFYAVSEPYRIPTLVFVVGLFLVCLIFFGGKQGLRGLLSLTASLFFIGFLLLPGILHGYSPVLLSVGISSMIVIVGSYITHGFNRTTTAAVIGMVVTILVTGILAYATIHSARLTGFTNEESTYLNLNTHNSIDFVGLLLGGLMIGLLGVLYDAAISQAIAVEELSQVGKHLSRAEIYKRGLRIGREHIGALVNILAIAYVGVSLPLLLLFEVNQNQTIMLTINQEVFATEIIRMMIGSIGLILAVPITTFVAMYMLHGREQGSNAHTGHHH